jgi:hypothetical protein
VAVFKIDRDDLQRDNDGNHVVAAWLVDELARGNEPATGSESYLRMLAVEVVRLRRAKETKQP